MGTNNNNNEIWYLYNDNKVSIYNFNHYQYDCFGGMNSVYDCWLSRIVYRRMKRSLIVPASWFIPRNPSIKQFIQRRMKSIVERKIIEWVWKNFYRRTWAMALTKSQVLPLWLIFVIMSIIVISYLSYLLPMLVWDLEGYDH